jgi:hypothetical protein
MISLLVILIILMPWAVFIFNRLVHDRNRVRAVWSDIGVQLKRRHDLFPRQVRVMPALNRQRSRCSRSRCSVITRSTILSPTRLGCCRGCSFRLPPTGWHCRLSRGARRWDIGGFMSIWLSGWTVGVVVLLRKAWAAWKAVRGRLEMLSALFIHHRFLDPFRHRWSSLDLRTGNPDFADPSSCAAAGNWA